MGGVVLKVGNTPYQCRHVTGQFQGQMIQRIMRRLRRVLLRGGLLSGSAASQDEGIQVVLRRLQVGPAKETVVIYNPSETYL